MKPEFIRQFEDGTFPKADWHHRQHLMVALWYVMNLPFEEALRHVREGIQKYNRSQGVEMTPTSGYHDSLTIFFVHRIAQIVRALGTQTFDAALEGVAAALGDMKASVREYYSRDRINSWEARTGWVEPDLKPLI